MTTNVPAGFGEGFNTSVMSKEQLAAFILAVVAQNSSSFTDAVITGSTIDSSPIGATVASTGAFTTLTGSTSIDGPLNGTLGVTSPAAAHATTLNNTTAAGSAINVASLGATTPGTAAVTALTVAGVTSFSNASISATALPTADPHVAGRLWANSAVVTVSAG